MGLAVLARAWSTWLARHAPVTSQRQVSAVLSAHECALAIRISSQMHDIQLAVKVTDREAQLPVQEEDAEKPKNQDLAELDKQLAARFPGAKEIAMPFQPPTDNVTFGACINCCIEGVPLLGFVIAGPLSLLQAVGNEYVFKFLVPFASLSFQLLGMISTLEYALRPAFTKKNWFVPFNETEYLRYKDTYVNAEDQYFEEQMMENGGFGWWIFSMVFAGYVMWVTSVILYEFTLREWVYYSLLKFGVLVDFKNRDGLYAFATRTKIFWFVPTFFIFLLLMINSGGFQLQPTITVLALLFGFFTTLKDSCNMETKLVNLNKLIDSRPKDDHEAKTSKEWFMKLRVVNEGDVKWHIEHILFENELAQYGVIDKSDPAKREEMFKEGVLNVSFSRIAQPSEGEGKILFGKPLTKQTYEDRRMEFGTSYADFRKRLRQCSKMLGVNDFWASKLTYCPFERNEDMERVKTLYSVYATAISFLLVFFFAALFYPMYTRIIDNPIRRVTDPASAGCNAGSGELGSGSGAF